MKKRLFFSCLILFALQSTAQDYQISFTGTGGSSIVETVLVQNLTQGTSLTMSGSDTLRLLGSLGIQDWDSRNLPIRVYPNPILDKGTIAIQIVNQSEVFVDILSVTGQLLCRKQVFLPSGTNTFSVSGLPIGMYCIRIATDDYSGSASFLSLSSGGSAPALSYLGSDDENQGGDFFKSSSSVIQMQYNNGDRLLMLARADIYSTVCTLIPTSSTDIAFNFIDATDGDGNHYPTVTIGTQVWMASNLMTTRYTDGGLIEYPGTDNAAWQNNTTGAYAWYNNMITFKETYGALYNWYAVDTSILCPAGWHVPSDEEWTLLTDFLGNTDVAGGKMKETGLTHWTNPNLDATNESGFTGLPGGNRNGDGSYGF
ncbi:MAG: T9SS type A sorting domain-containing protein, partial [Bacteroidales bacterium]|nr:T9SS type A sorting domain-containing protein [Bacteroidales bacterium]